MLNPEELRKVLMSTLEQLYSQHESKLMDFSTIQYKLSSGEYSDPGEYVDDVWLLFDSCPSNENKSQVS